MIEKGAHARKKKHFFFRLPPTFRGQKWVSVFLLSFSSSFSSRSSILVPVRHVVVIATVVVGVVVVAVVVVLGGHAAVAS